RARQQPAREQGFGQGHRRREATGDAEDREAVGERSAGTALRVRHPGERQPGIDQRLPERRLPGVVLGAIDRLRVGEVRENTRRRLADDGCALAHGGSWSAPGHGGWKRRHWQAPAPLPAGATVLHTILRVIVLGPPLPAYNPASSVAAIETN